MQRTKDIVLVVGFAALLIGVGVVFQFVLPHDHNAGDVETYESGPYGFSFTYHTEGSDAFTVLEPQEGLDTREGIEKTVVLMATEEYEALLADIDAGLPREGPPTVSILVFTNTENQTPLEWAQARPDVTNVQADAAFESTQVAGSDAVQFTADGLYPSRNVVIEHGSYLLVITGAYLEMGDATYEQFDHVLETLKL